MSSAGKSLRQVETASCYCGVPPDSSGAKRFVPLTARRCALPDAATPAAAAASRSKRLLRKRHGGDTSSAAAPLIPGLPDDLAVQCLARAPRGEHARMRGVCRRWYRLLGANVFYATRRRLGVAEEWVHVIRRRGDGRVTWAAFDPRAARWRALPPVPPEYAEALGFGCAVLGGCHLYLLGGKHPLRGSMRRAVFYSARTNRWHRAPDMLRRRHFAAAAAAPAAIPGGTGGGGDAGDGGCLLVAGGECDGDGGAGRPLRSCEVYDPLRRRWSYAADMATAMVPFIGVVYAGNWFLKGLGPHRQVMSEAYIPALDTWAPPLEGLVSGWRNPSAAVGGRLYALDCPDGCRLRVYDACRDSWSTSADSRRHLGGSRALEAAALLPLGSCHLCIVRNNLSITIVDVSSSAAGTWRTVSGGSGSGHLRTALTNLFSNLTAGRSNRLKSHIVHCQVLQA